MKELYEKFKNFKENYIFVQNEVYSDDDGNLLVNGEIIKPKDKKYGNESERSSMYETPQGEIYDRKTELEFEIF